MDPKLIRQWQGILRDFLIAFCGVFLLVYEAVWAPAVSWELVSAALTCFGLPAALRVDLKRKGDTEDEK